LAPELFNHFGTWTI